jgi:hypothetical protein
LWHLGEIRATGGRRRTAVCRRFLPEPTDLDLGPVHRTLYWTDRGDPPRGNTVNRATMDPGTDNGKEPEILSPI